VANAYYLTDSMKKFAVLVMAVLLFVCCKQEAQKPKKLISESEMADILYDLTVLQAAKAYSPVVMDNKKIDAKTYIFKKYHIDSLTFAENNKYYASNLEGYENIQNKVIDRIKAQKKETDSIVRGGKASVPLKIRKNRPLPTAPAK
jgi:hypothetical protein